jgi:hypothetical protein
MDLNRERWLSTNPSFGIIKSEVAQSLYSRRAGEAEPNKVPCSTADCILKFSVLELIDGFHLAG